MARSCLGIAALLALTFEPGCSHASTPEAGDAAADDAGAAVTLAVTAHVESDVAEYQCQFVSLPDSAAFLTGFSYQLSLGFHHLFAYQTDLTSMPPGGETPVDCFQGSPAPMDHARATVYGGDTASGSFALPAGVGLPVKPGQVLLLQSHLVNAGAAPLDITGSLTFSYATTDPGQHAGAFFFYDPFIDVGIGQRPSAGMRCPVPANVTILTTVGGAFSRVIGFDAFLDSPTQPTADPYYEADGLGDPLPIAGTLPLAAGSYLRFRCVYDNTGGTTEYFQGTDPATSEECILTGALLSGAGPRLRSVFGARRVRDRHGHLLADAKLRRSVPRWFSSPGSRSCRRAGRRSLLATMHHGHMPGRLWFVLGARGVRSRAVRVRLR